MRLNASGHALLAITFTLAVGASLHAADVSQLKPLLNKPGKVIISDDFQKPHKLNPKVFQQRQKTQWIIEDGLLKGIPATKEFQQSRKDHNGIIPRLMLLGLPPEYIIEFSFKLEAGETKKKQQAFFEFGHHRARVLYDATGLKLVTEHETITLDSKPDFKVKPGQWYHVLAEIKGDELSVQFQDGPTLKAKHASIAGEKDGFGIVGYPLGTIWLDNLKVSAVAGAK